MKNYVQVETKNAGFIDKYLKQGWEIIGTAKEIYTEGDSIVYHLGLPIEVAYQDALSKLEIYKTFGLDKVLDEKIKDASKVF